MESAQNFAGGDLCSEVVLGNILINYCYHHMRPDLAK